MQKFNNYINSFSTQLGFLMGILYYFSYALPNGCWLDKYLLSVSVFIAFFAPYYAKFSNKLDELVAYFTASVFLGRVGRFIAQFLFNVCVFTILLKGSSVTYDALTSMGGILGISFMISLMSQGLQYLALALANRDVGTKNANITISVSLSIFIGAIAAEGFPIAQIILMILGIILGIVGLFYSLYTDLRGLFAPRGGIGLFFGTFNPIHKTHVKIIKEFIQHRQLDKLIIHPTIIPKIHRIALEKGQIRIKEKLKGMRIYEKTEKADVHVNYFMTGNKFYEVEHRIKMLQIMVREEGLENSVEIWNLNDIYSRNGFYGIVAEIKKRFPKQKIHGLHGSDVGGMLVRAIYDESIGVIPYPVRRVDNVSATAIRSGKSGMTTKGVEHFIKQLTQSA